MGSLANSSSLQTTIQENPLLLPLSAFSQLSLLTLKPSPRLRLMPTTAIMATALPTTGTVMVWLTLMLTDTTTARGPLRLRLSPPPLLSPLLMPTLVIITVTALPTTGTTATLMLTMATTTARGPLMLSPLLMLTTVITTVMPHTVMLTAATTATLMLTATTATDIITKLLLFC